MFMIARRRPPVKQNPQSFLHPRKIAENRRKTQKSCKFNLQVGCGSGRTIWNVLRCALHINSGKNIYNFAFVALCGALQTLFSREGFGNELPQSKPDGFDSSLWEGAFGMAGRFLVALETLALRATACTLSVFASQIHLSQRERQERRRKLSHCT